MIMEKKKHIICGIYLDFDPCWREGFLSVSGSHVRAAENNWRTLEGEGEARRWGWVEKEERFEKAGRAAKNR